MSKKPDTAKAEDKAAETGAEAEKVAAETEAFFVHQLETPDINLGEQPTEAAALAASPHASPHCSIDDLSPEEHDELAVHGRSLGVDSLEVALRRADGDIASEAFIRLCFQCASAEESARSAGTYRTAAELAAQAVADAENSTPND